MAVLTDHVAEYDNIGAMLASRKPDVPVYALRLHEAERAAAEFVEKFPGDVLYAVKANPLPEILRALYAGGIRHFDTASLTEIRQLKEIFPAASAYFMHPVKSPAAIREAYQKHGITTFVVDHADELAKILIHTTAIHGTQLKPVMAIRLAMPRGMAVYDLGGKFGCSVVEAVALARAAAAEGLAVGFCFHVGSQCLDPAAYQKAIALVGNVITAANIHPEFIDVGGGFPVAYRQTKLPPLTDYMNAIKVGIADLKLQHPTRLLAEPGRALAASCASLIVKVELRRGNQLYLNDGMYGGLSELRFAGLDVPMRVWRVNGNVRLLASGNEDFRFCGPTCDSADILEGPFPLPSDIRAGDYIEFGQMGAYSVTLRSDFNGFQHADIVSVKDEAFIA